MILPTIRQLQYLVAVVDLNHFGQAAERCNVTQSTLSAGIAELENLLQAQLIERTKRRVQVTMLGEEIVEKARALLDAAVDIAETARAAEAPLSGRIRMGVIPTIAPFVLPRVLARLRRAYPDLRLYLREGQTEPLIGQLRRGELETALIALPFDIGDLEKLLLGPDPLWAVLPEGHPLAEARTVSPDDLAGEELLLLEDGHCLRDHALAACSLKGPRRAGGFQSTSLYTLVEMVANGLGVTFVPEIAITAGLLKGSTVEARPLTPDSPPRELALVWRRSYRREADLAALATYMRGQLATLRTKRPLR
ncbi:MAG: hydrogen peroxide-inducible genes activator [Alphaproteobacteria bacterium]|nr:hydrogen peroxide-inducible genes activator [Alphaproteobacteria bacterium]